MTLQILQLEARNVFGAREVIISPGHVTRIEGGNGTGKTSALKAAMQGLQGGNLASIMLLEDGPDGPCTVKTEPEIVIVLGDENGIPRHILKRKAGNKLELKTRVGDTEAFEDEAQPQTFLDSLIDKAATNPVVFLEAREQDLVKLILNAIPMSMDRARFDAILGEWAAMVRGREKLRSLHPIEEIDLTYDALFEKRKGINRDEKGKRSTADQLNRTVSVFKNDPAEELAEARRRKEELDKSLSQKTEAIAGDYEAELTAANTEASKALAAASAEYERVKAAALAILGAAEQAAKNDAVQARANALARKNDAEAAILPQREELAGLKEKLLALDRDVRAKVEQDTLRAQATVQLTMADELKAQSVELGGVMKELLSFSRDLAEHIPVAGLEIRGFCDECREEEKKTCPHQGVFVDGVPWEALNDSGRVRMAVKLCLLRSNTKLPVIFVDRAESLVGATLDTLFEELEKVTPQVFVSRAVAQDLSITSDGEPAGSVKVKE